MPAPDQILKLVDRFTANIADLKSANQNESSTRQDYIDPFFRALGWDVGNQQGRSEAEKEVKVEVSIRVDDARKAPDYGFYHNGELQFFVEAKKPIVNLKYGTNAAFQIRRYAWSTKKIALSILTDFEELAIYDCRTEPLDKDSADTARLKYFDYKEYPDKWDEIANLFSREAVAANSLDSYTASLKNQKGIVTVDAAFLKLIEHWRELLAKNLARRNPNLSQRELNSAVQTTIDRIIFLRFCEERDIQPYEEMKQLLDYSGIYERLCEIFNRADVRYNSGLFHLKDKDSRDHWMLGLKIDDAPLKEILYKLYYPAPYAFKAIPVEILGQVYEQFLGKVITLSPSHEASIEEKPEVRKAGGVYYTPGYIVEYIVKNTVGKLLEGQNPDQAAKLKILDPACGSGSFLLGAYQFLLDWYLNYYVSHNPSEHNKKKRLRSISTDTGILWQLTTDEKKRILLNNLYGVDIDTQAVEVTKLSLLLKMMEDESAATQQLQLLQERLLPDLDNNIKCGNSLIGPDFYDGQMVFPDYEEQLRINVFDWQSGFPAVFKQGGFDAVIGNPPYGAEFAQKTNDYLKAHFVTNVWRVESYLLFVEKALSLLRPQGLFGYIIPDTYLNLGFTQVLRDLLLQNTILQEVVLLPSNVFGGATVDTTLLFTSKVKKTDSFHPSEVKIKTFNKKGASTDLDNPVREFFISTKSWYEQKAFNLQSNSSEVSIFTKMEKAHKTVENISEMFYGIKTYQVGKGKPAQTEEIRDTKPFTSEYQKDESFLPFFDGKHIGRYELLWKQNNWLNYGPWLAEPRKPEKYEGEKILIRKIIGKTLIATYIPETSYCNTLLFVVKIKPEATLSYQYVLGILNSKLIGWYFRKKFQISNDDTFPQIMIRDILQFPIPLADKARHDDMVRLVERMLDLHKRIAAVNLSHEKTALQRQIEATDKQIDQLVYQLYQLTPEEITIVEG